MANLTDTAETRLITKTQMARVREVDFVQQFTHSSLSKLIEVLGVTRKIPMMEGTTLYYYTTTGTLQSGAVTEGYVIPLSQYQRNKTPAGSITLLKWRKAVSAEAIMKSGKEEAINLTDLALLRDVQKSVRTRFFSLLNGAITNSTPVTGVGMQAALAAAWGQLQVLFEDDTAEAVYFLNPLDVADYLGSAQVTMQTAFGMNYIENFLGLGTVILSSQITQGTFVATAKQNIVMYYLTMNGDVADEFNLTTDELGVVGICTEIPTHERAQTESIVMSGVTFFIEYAAGVVKGTITGAVAGMVVRSAAGGTSGKTAITIDGYEVPTGGSLVFTTGVGAVEVNEGDDMTSWTSWDGSADITATTGTTITVVVLDADGKPLATGSTVVTSKA